MVATGLSVHILAYDVIINAESIDRGFAFAS